MSSSPSTHHFRDLHPRVADHDGDGTFNAVRCPGPSSAWRSTPTRRGHLQPATGSITQRRIDVEEGCGRWLRSRGEPVRRSPVSTGGPEPQGSSVGPTRPRCGSNAGRPQAFGPDDVAGVASSELLDCACLWRSISVVRQAASRSVRAVAPSGP